MKKTGIVVCSLWAAFLMVSCENKGTAPESANSEKMAAAPHGTVEKEFVSVAGKVMEVTDGTEFTYLKIKTAAGEKWVAVPLSDVAVDEEVKISEGEVLSNFPSKTLGRTFPELIVAMGIEGKSSKRVNSNVSAGPHGGFPAQEKQGTTSGSFAAAMQAERGQAATTRQQDFDPALLGSNKAIVPFVDLKVDKATGKNGYTVGELFEKGEALNGKKIKVRGQVVKVSMNIMQKNWLHIQDGTGDTLKNTHDLVVTTSAVPKKGSIVVVEGELHAKRDFGAGYSYPVIIEDAMILE